jgi:hypothetical protein
MRYRLVLTAPTSLMAAVAIAQTSPPAQSNQSPPSANDEAAVMGKDRAWQNGRPPVDCAQTPMDSACH